MTRETLRAKARMDIITMEMTETEITAIPMASVMATPCRTSLITSLDTDTEYRSFRHTAISDY